MPNGTGTAAAAALWNDANAAEVARNQAQLTYVNLLNADTGTQADINAIAAAARTLGKSHVDVAADTKAILDAKALIASIQSRAGCGTVHSFVLQYLERHRAVIAASKKRLDAQTQALDNVLQDSFDQITAFQGDVKRLADLKFAKPILAPIATPDAESLKKQVGVTPEVFVPSFAAWLAAYVTLQASALPTSATPLPAPPP